MTLEERIRVMSVRYEVMRESEEDWLKEIKKAEVQLKDEQEAQIIIQYVANLTQEQIQKQLEVLPTTALQLVYGDEYSFATEFDIARGKTDANFFITKGDTKISPMGNTGGGVIDVLSFALRLACASMKQVGTKIFILDESFKHISKDLQPKIGEMLEVLTDKLGIQFIFVTHLPNILKGNENVINL